MVVSFVTLPWSYCGFLALIFHSFNENYVQRSRILYVASDSRDTLWLPLMQSSHYCCAYYKTSGAAYIYVVDDFDSCCRCNPLSSVNRRINPERFSFARARLTDLKQHRATSCNSLQQSESRLTLEQRFGVGRREVLRVCRTNLKHCPFL